MKLLNFIIIINFFCINLFAVINGSKHDLAYLNFTVEEDDGILCVFCHTPHGSNSNFSGNTLWDNDLIINETTYVVYDVNTDDTNTNPSKACLSCHDGVSAVNAVFDVSVSDTDTNNTIHDKGFFDNGHPISIDYNEKKASLNSKSGSFGANTKGYSATWHTPDGSQNIQSVLRNEKIECSSCHDPHLGENATFLRVKTNEKSFLCLGCHSK